MSKAAHGGDGVSGDGASDRESQRPPRRETAADVLTFAPNLIGYLRVALLCAACWFVNTDHRACLALYCASFGLDVLDGPVARRLQQSTRFGASLDMLTDKASTPVLLLALSRRHPATSWVLVPCVLLDVASHFFLVQATAQRGGRSHKAGSGVEASAPLSSLVRLFYAHKPFFGWTCLGHEIFVVALYWVSHEPAAGPLMIGGAPWAALQAMAGGGDGLLAVVLGGAASEGLHLLPLLALLALPSFLTKTVVHVAQLAGAVTALAAVDADERNLAAAAAVSVEGTRGVRAPEAGAR